MDKDPAGLLVTAEDDGLVMMEVVGYGQVEMTWMGTVELLHMLYAAAQVAALGVGVEFDVWARINQEAAADAARGISGE